MDIGAHDWRRHIFREARLPAVRAGNIISVPPDAIQEGGISMLWTLFVILLVLWLLGFGFHVAGGLIHLLLVFALIVLVYNLVTGRRAIP
jgi:hypothetical protein